MKRKVLIVEDQFLEADNLTIILKKEGYDISGVAKSVEEANSLIDKVRPDIVLVDIFLKGPLTGIDLAQALDKKISLLFSWFCRQSFFHSNLIGICSQEKKYPFCFPDCKFQFDYYGRSSGDKTFWFSRKTLSCTGNSDDS